MILPKDVFSEAYGALRQNRRRSAITILGMAWGIATVVLVAGIAGVLVMLMLS